MRIVAGEWRSRKIATLPEGDKTIRPTSDRARLAIFNILHGNHGLPEGARVLDLCCGTGALGLESLSRGAAHATFIDNSADALKLVKSSLMTFKANDRATLLMTDALRLPRAVEEYDLVFLDPPYRQNVVPPALAQLQAHGYLKASTLVVAEVGKDESLDLPPGFTVIDTRLYGAAKILLIKK